MSREYKYTVTVPLINQSKEADQEFWLDYLREVDPDHKEHLPYQRYLALRLKQALATIDVYNDH